MHIGHRTEIGLMNLLLGLKSKEQEERDYYKQMEESYYKHLEED